MRSGYVAHANIIKDCRTALDARNIGKLIIANEEFGTQHIPLMREILEAMALQVTAFRDAIKQSHKTTKFVEATYDKYWGAGINTQSTLHTDSEKWYGKNVLEGS